MTENDRAQREGFLARWSERKRAVRESEAAEEAAEAEAAGEAAQEGAEEEALAANRAAAEAVDLDSLTLGSDVSPFFKAGVPAALKQAALRKLWRSHPVFACLDGLDDYRDDYHDPKFLLKGGKSSWEPGSGYAKRIAELKEKAKEALAQAEARAGETAPGEAAPAEAAEAAEAGSGEQAEERPARQEAQAAAAENGPAAEEPASEAAEAEEAEPAPRVPLRSRVDFAAFKEED